MQSNYEQLVLPNLEPNGKSQTSNESWEIWTEGFQPAWVFVRESNETGEKKLVKRFIDSHASFNEVKKLVEAKKAQGYSEPELEKGPGAPENSVTSNHNLTSALKRWNSRELFEIAKLSVAGEALYAKYSTSPEILQDLKDIDDYAALKNLASNLATPSEILNYLARIRKSGFRPEYNPGMIYFELLENPNTPKSTLVWLQDFDAYDGELEYNPGGNPHASASKLREIASTPSEWREDYPYGLARNPNTPPDILLRFSQVDDFLEESDFIEYLLKNPSFPPEGLLKFSTSEEDYFRELVAAHGSTPEETLEVLAKDPIVAVRVGVTQNPAITNKVLKILSKDKSDLVRFLVTTSGFNSVEFVRSEIVKFATKPSNELRRELSANPITPSELLIKPVKEISNRLRIAADLSTPARILSDFAKDEETVVRAKVAKNPNTPEDVLASLSKDEDWRVRENAAGNPGLPINELTQLAVDGDSSVRSGVARNPSAPVNVLTMLAEDEYWQVRENAAGNPGLPINGLTKLAKDEVVSVREVVFKNENTPTELLEELKNDFNLIEYQKSVAADPATNMLLFRKTLENFIKYEISWGERIAIQRDEPVGKDVLALKNALAEITKLNIEICAVCGTKPKTGASYCSKCGSDLALQIIYCPDCGTTCGMNDKFCDKCGGTISDR